MAGRRTHGGPGGWRRGARAAGAALVGAAVACGGPGAGDPDAAGADAAAVPIISEAGLCALDDPPRLSVTPGTDLWRATLDAPDAVCNDGTPAVMYVSPAPAASPHADRWLIWLEGGGACNDPASCADRWCGRQGIYSAAKMSSAWAPAGIRGAGIFRRAASAEGSNDFRGYQMAILYYCTSDSWSGRAYREVEAGADHPAYALHLKGAHVVEAAIAALKAGVTSDPGPIRVTMPSIDDASLVLLTGTSAGASGARWNADRVAAWLRATNPSVDVRLVVDAAFNPEVRPDPPAVSAEDADAMLEARWDVQTRWRDGVLDESCLAHHAGDDPRVCADLAHVLVHHVGVPWYVKMDLTDAVTAPAWYPDVSGYARAIQELLRAVADDHAGLAEEPADPAAPPGIFAPSCGHHVNLDAPAFHRVRVLEEGEARSNHDVLSSWVEGQRPRAAIHDPPGGVTSICP